MVGWGIREEINPLVIIRHMFGRIIRLPRLIASFLQESGNLWTIGHSVEVIRPLTLVCNVLNEIRKKKNKENEIYTTDIDDLSTKFIHLMHKHTLHKNTFVC